MIGVFLRDARLRAPVRDQAVFKAWREAAAGGSGGLARMTTPVRFRDRTLVVEVSSAAHLQELRGFTGEALRGQMNQILGAARVDRVTFQIKR